MYNTSLYAKLERTNRSFDIDTPVDAETIQVLRDIIGEFKLAHPNIIDNVVTDKDTCKLIYYIGSCNRTGEHNGFEKFTQLWAPLIIEVRAREMVEEDLFHVGRLYSKLSLTAIQRGYKIGFSNSIDGLDPRLRQLESTLQFSFDDITRVVQRVNEGNMAEPFVIFTFLCIGKPLLDDDNHRWDWVRQRNFNSGSKLTDEFIRIHQ
jgi:hypothetical protein